MLRKNIAVLLFISIALVILGSCGWIGKKLDLDTDLALYLQVDTDINPDNKKRPSPLFVRLYGLKSVKMFDKADFISLYERDKEVLGADFVSKQELKRLIPGESRKENFVLKPGTRFIGLFAEFSNYRKPARYKIIAPVVSNNVFATSITIQISGNRLFVIEKDTTIKYESDDDKFFDGYAIEE